VPSYTELERRVNVTTDVRWLAEHVRISLFSSDVWPDASIAFSTAFGPEPAHSSANRLAGEASASGKIGGVSAEVKTFVNRIDFILRADAPMAIGAGLDFPAALDMLQPKVIDYLESAQSFPDVHRIAVGTQAFIKMDSARDALQYLAKTLHDFIRIDSEAMDDFNLYLNIPRASLCVPDLRINRLCQWSPQEYQVSLVGSHQIIGAALNATTNAFCVIQPDVNTDAKRQKKFERAELKLLCNELCNEVRAIVQQGRP
jgi:hypothetical protein